MALKTDSEATSLAASSPSRSPRRPFYYVMSPSQPDPEKMSYNGSTPNGSPPHHPPNHYRLYQISSEIDHSRESATTPFSASLKRGAGQWNKIAGMRQIKDGDYDDEFDHDDDRDSNRRLGVGCYLFLFVLGFVVLFSFFSLILWGASRSYKPQIYVKSVVFEFYNVQAGLDEQNVPLALSRAETKSHKKPPNSFSFFSSFKTLIMKISNNENSDKIHSPKSRRSSRLRPKPFSDLTNIQTTLPEAEAELKIEQEPGKENLAPCRPDKFVFFSNLKFIPESEEVASTSGQDNNKNNDLMESEDPLWLVKAIEKVNGENDLDASSQSCPIIGTKRSRKITKSVTHKQKVHGTFPLPASKTRKRKRNLVSPINIKEPLRPERSTEKQFLGAIKHEEPLRSATSVKKRPLGSLIEHENLLHSEASVETQSSKAPKKHKEPLYSEATVEKQSSKAPPIEHEEPSSAELNTDIKGPILLPPEFVEERKAYFSQIDAFELEEESENSDDESTVV